MSVRVLTPNRALDLMVGTVTARRADGEPYADELEASFAGVVEVYRRAIPNIRQGALGAPGLGSALALRRANELADIVAWWDEAMADPLARMH